MPSQIAAIDAYARDILQTETSVLMERAGAAVAAEVMRFIPQSGARILVLCGVGNNGGDGYAAARLLLENGYDVCAVDVFNGGQRTEEGKSALRAFEETVGATLVYGIDTLSTLLNRADCVVEAVFGAGARPDYPQTAVDILSMLTEEQTRRTMLRQKRLVSVAVDCPLGINAADGTARNDAFFFDVTVELSFSKIGTHSYPARRYAGKITLNTLALPVERLRDNFGLQNVVMDDDTAKVFLPNRPIEGHKGTFGTLGVLAGSAQYPGAALLACESALRGGVGLLRYFGEHDAVRLLLARRPEAVCQTMPDLAEMSEADAETFFGETPRVSAWLVGCGCGRSAGLANCLRILLTSEGAPLVLDADALNVLADPAYDLLTLLAKSKRSIVMTPHPLEFARLAGSDVECVQSARLNAARDFAAKHRVTLLLKGAATLTASPDARIAVNTSGNTALSKGGSGDVLAGLVASFVAQGLDPFESCALGAYLHGCAANTLSLTLGEAGVLPADLPMAIAQSVCRIESKEERKQDVVH